jgi:multiple antibiotic resistance protein
LNEFVNTILLVFAGLFPIVNPIGGAPIFLGFTRQNSESERGAIALRVAVNGFFLLLGSLFVGSHVLEFFGITLPVVRVAGGLVVTAFAWQLLHSGVNIDQPSGGPGASFKPATADDAFYPLTLPLTVGPGSIAVAITLGSQRPRGVELTQTLMLGGVAVIGLVAVCLSVYLCYRYAERVAKVLGESGTNVVVRLSAFILLCIGVQIIWGGWAALSAAPAS